MRNLVSLSILLLLSTFAGAAQGDKNAEYASNAANIFSKFETREDFVQLVSALTNEADRKLLEERLKEIPSIPKVRAQGAKLIITVKNEIDRLTVVDGDKDLFQYRGVEIDLSPDRPLAERLSQIEELANRKSSSFWNFLLPEANALQNLGYPVAVAVVGAIANSQKKWAHYGEVIKVTTKLTWLCDDMKGNVNSKARTSFGENKVAQTIDDDENVSKPPKYYRNIANWQTGVTATLERMQPEYCAKGFWHQMRKVHPDSLSFNKESACDEISKALKCYKDWDENREVLLYQIQHQEVVKWLKVIDPSISETQLAHDVTVMQRTQVATKAPAKGKAKTQTAKGAGAAR